LARSIDHQQHGLGWYSEATRAALASLALSVFHLKETFAASKSEVSAAPATCFAEDKGIEMQGRSLVHSDDTGFTADDVYKVIVDGLITYDLHADPLADSHRSLVYRDQSTLDFARRLEADRAGDQIDVDHDRTGDGRRLVAVTGILEV
jgi:hypothetical protein